MTIINKKFAKDTAQPDQTGNIDWWESNPMTYDWSELDTGYIPNSDWFKKVDSEFWEISKIYAHPNYPNQKPFSNIIPFDFIKSKTVLEIGCGSGSHAQLLACNSKKYVGIDITKTAIRNTTIRLEQLSLKNFELQCCDAEKLPFPNETFDYIWSWGVIHHSSNTEKIVAEIFRVLKAGGKSTIMIYNKNSTRYYLWGLYQGIFKLKFLKYRSLYQVNMSYTDGYIARHYTKRTASDLFKMFNIERIRIVDGEYPDMVPVWNRLAKKFPKIFGKINKLIAFKFGWFMVVDISKS